MNWANDTQAKILELIENDNRITREKLANKLNITPDGVKYK